MTRVAEQVDGGPVQIVVLNRGVKEVTDKLLKAWCPCSGRIGSFVSVLFNDFLAEFVVEPEIKFIYRVFIKYCVFSHKNLLSLATSPSPALGCYWLYRKWPANKSDCTLRSLVRMSCSPTFRGWVAVNWEKTQFLMNTLYLFLSF